jgi:hypothetical protein
VNVRSIWEGLFEKRKASAAAAGGCAAGAHVWLVSDSRFCAQLHVHVEGFCAECREERERTVSRFLFSNTALGDLHSLLAEELS